MASLADLPELVGFFSYSREDDVDSQGALSALRTRIQGELRSQLGRTAKTFRLWQDKEAISAGTLWKTEIEAAVAQSAFFIPIITPTVVNSEFCQFELQQFLAREVALGREDLLFPILYIRVPALEDSARRETDPVISIIAKRQYVDWRGFRFRPINSPEVLEAVESFCAQICHALSKRWISPEERAAQEEALALQRAEAELKRQEAYEARRREQEARQKAEAQARQRAEEERRRREAEAEAGRRAEEQRLRSEVEAERRADEERRRTEELERRVRQAQAEAARQPDEEHLRCEAEAKRWADEERRLREAAAAEAARKSDEGRGEATPEKKRGRLQLLGSRPQWRRATLTAAAVAALIVGAALAMSYWRVCCSPTPVADTPTTLTSRPAVPLTATPAAAPSTDVALSPGRERALKPEDTFRECANCPQMVVVPAGSFPMGSPTSEPGRSANEGPQHAVTIGPQFAVGRFDVTFNEWDACVANGGCNGYRLDDEGWGRSIQPAINVSWEDAKSYVAWLSKKTGKPYRLLSEAEWEYAARGGTQTLYPWGDAIGKNNANCDSCGSQWDFEQPAAIGQFAPNGFGLYDMAGNTWQWVEDCYHDTYQGAPGDGSAWIEGADCRLRVVRGGSWGNDPEKLRPASRDRHFTETRSGFVGFRVARTLITP